MDSGIREPWVQIPAPLQIKETQEKISNARRQLGILFVCFSFEDLNGFTKQLVNQTASHLATRALPSEI